MLKVVRCGELFKHVQIVHGSKGSSQSPTMLVGFSKETMVVLTYGLYAGPFSRKMWLIMIDAYSKWPEIHAMSTTTAQATTFRDFYTIGLPEWLIIDISP